MDNLLPIGRFARVVRLSIKALRHYDELGLLRPALVDAESGYRYYSPAQAVEAERIRLLRELDVPLDEIALVLRERDPAAVRARLSGQAARLEARIAEDRRRLDTLATLTDPVASPLAREVRVRTVPEQQVLSIRRGSALPEIGRAAARAFGELFAYLGGLGVRPAGPPLSLYEGSPEEEELIVEWCVPVARGLVGRADIEGRLLPGVSVACTLHAGPYDEVTPAYGALAAWVQSHGHEEAGPPREVYLVGPAQTANPSEFRTEIQWPIRP